MIRLMDDFQPLIIPSTLRMLIEGHKANIKCIDTLGPGSNLVISGSRSVTVYVAETERKRADDQ
jgi:COMPASS component SWD3